MFRKLILIFVLISLGFFEQASAQDQRFKAGIILGSNFSQIDGDRSNGYIKPGITGGLRGVAIINDKVDLSIELLFDQRGSRSQSIFDDNFFPFKITNNYVSVPVIFNYQDWLHESEEYYKLHFHVGFSYGRLLNTQIDDEDENSIFVPLSMDFRQDDISVLVGTTYYVNSNFGITGRFSRGLNPLYRNGDGLTPVRIPLISKFLTLQLIYMF